MKLLAFTGFAGVGKTYAATALEGWERIHFAEPLRNHLLLLNPLVSTGLHLKECVSLFGWDKAKRDMPEVRRLMQCYGTEIIRRNVCDNYWVDLAEKRIEESGNHCVICDCRFSNEAAMIRRRRGLLVRITRPDVGPANGHSSENQQLECDVEIHNAGTPCDLFARVREVAGLLPDRISV
jgi:hypothetical protein